jgi:transposase-like protein
VKLLSPLPACRVGCRGTPPSPKCRRTGVSVLSTSVTKQIGDMVYSGARRVRILGIGHARRCCMPWKEMRIMDQRLQFLSSYQKEEMSVGDLCRAYEISRLTAYRWINRYNETGPEGLVDRSSRPTVARTRHWSRSRTPSSCFGPNIRRAQAQGEAGDATARRGLACS